MLMAIPQATMFAEEFPEPSHLAREHVKDGGAGVSDHVYRNARFQHGKRSVFVIGALLMFSLSR
jgi:hypothetical protein